MTQERRRYGFVLERQCSLAKHWMAYHTSGKNCLSSHLDSWDEVSASREFLPPNVENMFAKNIKASENLAFESIAGDSFYFQPCLFIVCTGSLHG